MCNCQHITHRFLCRHKRKEITRCGFYDFKKNNLCMAFCMSSCRPHKITAKPKCLCKSCNEYFDAHFGEHSRTAIKQYLRYKKDKGWTHEAIDPQTISRHAYISPEVLATLQADDGSRTQQPFKVKSPMRAVAPPPPLSARRLLPPPPVQRNKIRERRLTPYEFVEQPASECSFDLAARGELPEDYDQKGRPHAASSSRKAKYAPVREHGTNEVIYLDDLIGSDVEEESDSSSYIVAGKLLQTDLRPRPEGPSFFQRQEAKKQQMKQLVEGDRVREKVRSGSGKESNDSEVSFRIKRDTSELPLLHPQPQNRAFTAPQRAKKLRPREAQSSSSLVKKLHAAAETIRIPDYANPESSEYPDVPKITPAPRTPSWRQSSPRYSHTRQDEDREPITVVATPAKRKQRETPAVAAVIPGLRTAPAELHTTYFVEAQADSSSPTGAAASVSRFPSHSLVAVPPPQRLEGVLANPCGEHGEARRFDCASCRDSFFEERGLATDEHKDMYYHRAIRSAQPVLVSVSVPSPSYSFAVQASCYCSDNEGYTCDTCFERRRQSDELHMVWI